MSAERIKELQTKLRARQGKDGLTRNCEVIREEIRRLGGKA